MGVGGDAPAVKMPVRMGFLLRRDDMERWISFWLFLIKLNVFLRTGDWWKGYRNN